ncbi:hypothetical protein [Asticcacaulis benevestitus]|uniref:hypothetical protein n=1 Tax=Asticcacaulis benevestitus TaxID=347481 RepID=UPI000A4808CF|nr:hypothetical protein [Asticcacaulis benevestitus]
MALGTSFTEGFHLEPANQLQTFLFKNCQMAIDLGVWQPIGNYVLEELRGDHTDNYIKKLNRPHSQALEERDLMFMAIQFFDIMVRRAAYQGVRDNMWLAYMQYFVAEIDKTAVIDPEEADEEFPTYGSRCIYEIFHILGTWVNLVKSLSAASLHLKLDPEHRYSIPASAARAIGVSLKTIMRSERLPGTFKGYMLRCVLGDVKGLQQTGVQAEMRALLIEQIVYGGDQIRTAEHTHNLILGLSDLDGMLRHDVADFIAQLEKPV